MYYSPDSGNGTGGGFGDGGGGGSPSEKYPHISARSGSNGVHSSGRHNSELFARIPEEDEEGFEPLPPVKSHGRARARYATVTTGSSSNYTAEAPVSGSDMV